MRSLKFHVLGEFPRGSVTTDWVPDSRLRIPEIESAIDSSWDRASQRPGVKLFDGPMCRLEAYEVTQKLSLRLSQTSYKIFMGTNLAGLKADERFLANPVGMSAALETSDGVLVLGRRDSRVAYHPSRIHPFAGTLEPRGSLDVFDEIERELREELSLSKSDIAEITCLGIAEDFSVRQPELIFHVMSRKSRQQIEAQLDKEEHVESVSVDASSIERMLNDPMLTPIACATLLLWGRRKFSPAWFEAAKRVTSIS